MTTNKRYTSYLFQSNIIFFRLKIKLWTILKLAVAYLGTLSPQSWNKPMFITNWKLCLALATYAFLLVCLGESKLVIIFLYGNYCYIINDSKENLFQVLKANINKHHDNLYLFWNSVGYSSNCYDIDLSICFNFKYVALLKLQ